MWTWSGHPQDIGSSSPLWATVRYWKTIRKLVVPVRNKSTRIRVQNDVLLRSEMGLGNRSLSRIVNFTCRFITSINGAFFPASDCYTEKQNLSLVHNLKRCVCNLRSMIPWWWTILNPKRIFLYGWMNMYASQQNIQSAEEQGYLHTAARLPGNMVNFVLCLEPVHCHKF